MTTTAFSHMGIACKDPVVIEKFYSKYFGFERARVVPLGDTQIVFIKSGDVYWNFFKPKKNRRLARLCKMALVPRWRTLPLAVDNVDAKLAELGDAVTITSAF